MCDTLATEIEQIPSPPRENCGNWTIQMKAEFLMMAWHPLADVTGQLRARKGGLLLVLGRAVNALQASLNPSKKAIFFPWDVVSWVVCVAVWEEPLSLNGMRTWLGRTGRSRAKCGSCEQCERSWEWAPYRVARQGPHSALPTSPSTLNTRRAAISSLFVISAVSFSLCHFASSASSLMRMNSLWLGIAIV